MLGFPLVTGAVGVAHGGLAGYRQIYPWRRPLGVVAFVLDHSWALATSLASLVSHGVSAADRGSVYIAALSERQARHVFAGGFRIRKGFAITLGTTVSGVADTSERRWQLVTDHEDVHVWQARSFGPLYPLLYLAWMLIAAGAGAFIAVSRRRPLGATIEAYAYYNNPFEWWAYSRQGRWPPPRLEGHVRWHRPLVKPLSMKRESRATPR